ncbi:hypothetical protein ARTHRO9V_40050 [Arthrobacter sp. 9V]|nr:hypothetical protein ARTHRO9V_40050 [Arthrobacter sp. 9V]
MRPQETDKYLPKHGDSELKRYEPKASLRLVAVGN